MKKSAFVTENELGGPQASALFHYTKGGLLHANSPAIQEANV